MAIIEARGLARTFKSRKRTVEAVRGVDLTVGEGEIVGFLGPNGAGKTTTLRMLTTLLRPTAGTATVAGADLLRNPLRVREKIAYRARVPSNLSTLRQIDVAQASERPLRLGFAKGRWRINDRVFAMGEAPIEVKRGTVETWLIRNYFNSMPHAMHLHGFPFEVLERQTSPDQVAALKIDDRGRLATDLGRKDTVLVWPGETVRVAVDFTLPSAAAYAGDQVYMFHCHNLEHEDGGMMLGVRVT